MSAFAWILAGILAAVYIAAGAVKLAQPRERLLQQANFAWVDDFSQTHLRGIGTVEVLGGLGLVLPWLLNIARVLTPVAALGLTLVQVAAITVHLRRGEQRVVPANMVLLLLSATLAAVRATQL